MDARTNMIIANGKPISSDVVYCNFDEHTGKWDITFKNGKTYHYAKWKVTVLKESKSLNPKSYQVWYKEKLLSDITAINSFVTGKRNIGIYAIRTGMNTIISLMNWKFVNLFWIMGEQNMYLITCGRLQDTLVSAISQMIIAYFC